MTNELVIDVQAKEVSIALLEDKSLVELQKENTDSSYVVGNIYLGKVKKLMPGLNACFIDIGYEKDAFLHYQDLGSQFASQSKYIKQVQSNRKKLSPISQFTPLADINKDGSISHVLSLGQEVLVQIVKEPISTKGPRLTCELSFAGRYLVLIPFNDKVSVSQKIKTPGERTRLKQLVQSIKPNNFGVIIRTVAEGKRVAELDSELKVLVKHWEDCVARMQKVNHAPAMVYEETSRAVALIRDIFNPSFENIYVNRCERLIGLGFKSDFWFGSIQGDQSFPGGISGVTFRNITSPNNSGSSINRINLIIYCFFNDIFTFIFF